MKASIFLAIFWIDLKLLMEQDQLYDWRNYLELNENQQELMRGLLYDDEPPQDYYHHNNIDSRDGSEDSMFQFNQLNQNQQSQHPDEDFHQQQLKQSQDHLQQHPTSINQSHVTYLREIYELSRVEFYKSEFKFNKKIKEIYLTKPNIDARQLFEDFSKCFSQLNFDLCEIKIQVYCKKNQQQKINKYLEKSAIIEEVIQHILNKYCYGHQPKQKMIIQQDNAMKETIDFILFHQYMHFTLKIPKQNQKIQQERLKTITWNYTIEGRSNLLQVQLPKFQHKDYLSVSNCSYCNSLSQWNIGCRVKQGGRQTFYTYFQPKGEDWVTFSRSMHRDQEANIRQICFYTCYDHFVLRTVIKKEQIYLLSYSDEQNIYIFISSPPVYEVCILPPKTYCRPNYLKYWSRIENFLLVRHQQFKDNNFLRLFLYSNSYIHLKLNRKDTKSYQNIRFDIQLLQIELKCKRQRLLKTIRYEKSHAQLLTLFDEKLIKQSLSFLRIRGKPFLTCHKKWKLQYQIMLLIRFNVIGPEQLQDFLRLVQINQAKFDIILQCLSLKSAGFTNKIAGLNRCRKDVYLKLKQKIMDFVMEYDVKKRENRQNQNKCFVYKVSVTPSGVLPNPISAQSKSRLIRQYEAHSQFFLKVTLLDDSGFTIKNQQYLNFNYMRSILNKIVVLDRQYLPLGWSGSQLRATSIWYVSEIPKNEGDFRQMTQKSILRFLGDFSKITIAAKKAARIGQAFSSSFWFNSQNVNVIVQKDDKSTNGFLFTDEIGKISKDLFQQICKKFQGVSINCCFQIRYKGAKGVLLLNEELSRNTIALRQSMVKYGCEDTAAKKYLDIVSWDKYLPGYLNRQIIILLKSLKITDEAFLKFQRRYIKQLTALTFREIDGNLLRIFNDADDAEGSFILTISSLKDHLDLSRDIFFDKLLESIKDAKFKELKKKSRILIEKSARLIGVIDDYDVLRDNQLYCSIRRPKQQNVQVISGYVIITRNPSLSPADVRRCRCISKEQIGMRLDRANRKNYFQRFINCIVFPKKGAVPLTAQISGSDLDGDIFFICWDDHFIVQEPEPLQTIDDPNKKSPFSHGQPDYKQMLDFFVKFANNQILGRINNIHTVLADRAKSELYARDNDCRLLAKIIGKVVDYGKSGQSPEKVPSHLAVRQYPDFMEKWDKPSYKSNSILGLLYRECRRQFEDHKKLQQKKQFQLIKDFVTFIERQEINKDLIKKVMRLLKSFEIDISDLLGHANVGTEFELYGGHSSENEELRNEFGRSRLADLLHNVIQRHLKKFLESHQAQLSKYRRLKRNKLKLKEHFCKQTYRKAVLAYLASYICYLDKQNIGISVPMKLRRDILECKQACRYNGSFVGYIWVVIPKIVVNLKLMAQRVMS